MLEGLDRIDWERLTHAYGPSGEVPGWIRDLASDDVEVRRKALEGLHATICHQGSRYRASAPAVPFLFELLEAPNLPDQAPLIGLLVGLAVGYAEWHVPLGFDPAQRFAEIEALGGPDEIERIRAAEPDEEEDFDPGRDALWQRDAYEAVIGRIATFHLLTRDAAADVRTAALKALAWFPEAAGASIPYVRDAFARDSGPKERANAILSLGILARYLDDRSDVPGLLACLSADDMSAVRVAAAISLAVILGKSAPEECLSVLFEAVLPPEPPDLVGWHWLGPVAHASAAIIVVGPEPTEAVLAELSRAAEQAQDTWKGAEVIKALLSVVFPDPSDLPSDPKTGFRRVVPERLTAEQRQALYAIGRAPAWSTEPYYYGGLMDVGLEYGLPWHPDKYRALLEEVRRCDPGG
jgi:hypothetical protein